MERRMIDMPEIETLALKFTARQLAEHYGVSIGAMFGRLRSRGLSAQPPFIVRRGGWTAPRASQQPKGATELAVDFLRRECPVYRISEDGRPSQTGSWFCYGRRKLSERELVAVARRKGFRA